LYHAATKVVAFGEAESPAWKIKAENHLVEDAELDR
jgi:hypothetical protein